MCEAHNHAATDAAAETATETATAETTAHDHGAHDHAAHDHSAHDHGTHDHGTGETGAHHHDVAVVDSETAECLVMRGSYINKSDAEAAGLVREYEGTKYYLCCAACGPLFDAAPEKYAAAAA